MEMTGFITKPNARIFRECGWLEICRPSLTIHVNLLWLFPSQNERHYIMQVVCEATQCTHNPVNSIGQCALFSLGLNDRPQRPVVLFSALSFFLSALSFLQRPVIFREPFGFFGLLSALFWAWSCRKRPIKSDISAILDLCHRFRHESEATLMTFEGM